MRCMRPSKFAIPDDDHAADLYALTQEITAARGLPAYEISNHARPGAESRHNLTYWRYGEYVGVGPGAHGRFVENGRRDRDDRRADAGNLGRTSSRPRATASPAARC